MNIKLSLKQSLPYILIASGLVGLISGAVLTYDVYQSLVNPNFKPNCNINPVLSCGSVMNSDQGTIFGFPNPIIGLVVYPTLAVIGVAMLAGAKFKKWFWTGLNLGLLAGTAFVFWLFFQSVYRIQAVCPYCAMAWVATITSFWYVTLYNFDQGVIKIKKGRLNSIAKWVRNRHLDILLVVFGIITVLILKHFWWYYGRNF